MRIGLKESIALHREDGRDFRKKMCITGIITVAAFLFFMNAYSAWNMVSPAYTWGNVKLWIEYGWASLTGHPTFSIINARPQGYDISVANIKGLFMAMACGALLALSGNIFQNVFRNPMATPTMLGVNTGVQLAMLYMTVTYQGLALSMTMERYKYCYIGAALMLVLVLVLGKISSGRGRFQVEDLLLVGVASSQIIGAVVSAYTGAMDTDVLAIYQLLNSGSVLEVNRVSILCLTVAFAVSVIPMYLLRFSFNAVSYSPDEARGMGIDSGPYRFITLIIGTFMITAAMVHCGSIGMLSLAVPFICRYLFGSEYRQQFWANILIGALFMLICKGIVNMLPYVGPSQKFPISIVVNIMVPPLFALFLVRSKRGWE